MNDYRSLHFTKILYFANNNQQSCFSAFDVKQNQMKNKQHSAYVYIILDNKHMNGFCMFLTGIGDLVNFII